MTPSATREVLLVDDEPDLAFALALGLELAGYRVRSAGTGEEALALLEEREPDAIVLDLRLPGIDGREVLRRLAEKGRVPKIPVVVLSAHVDDEAVSMAAGFGCHAYLSKPCSPQALNQTLAAALRAGSDLTTG